MTAVEQPAVRYSRRELVTEIRAVQVECVDGFGGTTPGVMAHLFRDAADVIDRHQAEDGVFVGVGYESEDEHAYLRLFFEYDPQADGGAA